MIHYDDIKMRPILESILNGDNIAEQNWHDVLFDDARVRIEAFNKTHNNVGQPKGVVCQGWPQFFDHFESLKKSNDKIRNLFLDFDMERISGHERERHPLTQTKIGQAYIKHKSDIEDFRIKNTNLTPKDMLYYHPSGQGITEYLVANANIFNNKIENIIVHCKNSHAANPMMEALTSAGYKNISRGSSKLLNVSGYITEGIGLVVHGRNVRTIDIDLHNDRLTDIVPLNPFYYYNKKISDALSLHISYIVDQNKVRNLELPAYRRMSNRTRTKTALFRTAKNTGSVAHDYKEDQLDLGETGEVLPPMNKQTYDMLIDNAVDFYMGRDFFTMPDIIVTPYSSSPHNIDIAEKILKNINQTERNEQPQGLTQQQILNRRINHILHGVGKKTKAQLIEEIYRYIKAHYPNDERLQEILDIELAPTNTYEPTPLTQMRVMGDNFNNYINNAIYALYVKNNNVTAFNAMNRFLTRDTFDMKETVSVSDLLYGENEEGGLEKHRQSALTNYFTLNREFVDELADKITTKPLIRGRKRIRILAIDDNIDKKITYNEINYRIEEKINSIAAAQNINISATIDWFVLFAIKNLDDNGIRPGGNIL